MTPTAYLNESLNNLIKQIKYMKCRKYNCNKEATAPYYACSMTHSLTLKQAIEWIRDMKYGTLTLDDFYSGKGAKLWSVGEYLHYLDLVK